jgi:hypothetical protein
MKLKYWTLSLAALAAVAAVTPPANAQYMPGYYPGQTYPYQMQNPNLVSNPEVVRSAFASRFSEISTQINTAVSNGQLSPAEASNLMSGMNQISAELNNAMAGGLTNDESNALVSRLSVFAQQVSGQITANSNLLPPSVRASMPGGWNYRGNSNAVRRLRDATRNGWNRWR